MIWDIFEFVMQNLHLLVRYRECLSIYQISNWQYLLEYVSFIILIVITDRVSVLIQQSLSKAIWALLNWPQILDTRQNFIKVLLDIVSDVIGVSARWNNQDVSLVGLHFFFHLTVDFNWVFVVVNSKNTFIKEIELLEDIKEV